MSALWRTALTALALAGACAEARTNDSPRSRSTEAKMELGERVKTLAEAWEAHRQSVIFSSNIKDTLDCPAYPSLVALGEPAVPFIIERYRTDDLPWGFVLQDITGVRMIDNPRAFRPDEVRRRWIEWWEKKQAGQAK